MWSGVEKEHPALSEFICLAVKEDVENQTTEAVTVDTSMLAAVLTIIPVVSLILLLLLCVRCKKKTKIINEEHQIYDPPIFQRGGSLFAVTHSKTVTRANTIPSATLEIPEATEDISAVDDQSEYQNITEAPFGSPEHTYVAPLPLSVYANETKTMIIDADQNPGVYENIIISLPINDDGEDEDYENTAFLDLVLHQQDDNESDYLNGDGT